MTMAKMGKDLRPLCYEHYVAMKPVQLENGTHTFTTHSLAYACPLSGCFIFFSDNTGYFSVEGDEQQSKQTGVLRVTCPQDGLPMYLAEVHPQKKNLRLWRCGKPNCKGHRAIEEYIFDPHDASVQQYFRTN